MTKNSYATIANLFDLWLVGPYFRHPHASRKRWFDVLFARILYLLVFPIWGLYSLSAWLGHSAIFLMVGVAIAGGILAYRTWWMAWAKVAIPVIALGGIVSFLTNSTPIANALWLSALIIVSDAACVWHGLRKNSSLSRNYCEECGGRVRFVSWFDHSDQHVGGGRAMRTAIPRESRICNRCGRESG